MEISGMIEVLQRAEKGEIVECRPIAINDGLLYEWRTTDNPNWNFSKFDYRIKPETKQVPLTKEDLIERRKLGFEAMWVKSKQDLDFEYIIEQIRPDGCFVHNSFFAYYELELHFVWLDGTPCSKVVEDE